MLVPYVLTNLRKNLNILVTYTVAYIRSLDIIITKRATCFVVSVPANIFILAQPNNYIYKNVNLGSRLQLNTSIYVYPYIYFRIKATR